MLNTLIRGLCLILLGLMPFSTLAAETVMDEKTQTWCFGRYLIDIPLEAESHYTRDEYLGAGIGFSQKMTKAAFQEEVAGRTERIEAGYGHIGMKARGGSSGLEKRIAVGEEGAILTHWWAPYSDSRKFASRRDEKFYYIESFKFDNGWVFSTQREYPVAEPNTDTAIRMFTKLVQTVRYRPENEIPKEPGICLRNGFIASGENTGMPEAARIGFIIEHNPNVWITIESRSVDREGAAFREGGFPEDKEAIWLQEANWLQQLFRSAKIKGIRSGSQTINGLTGQESLVTATYQGDRPGIAHSFVWKTNGELKNPNKPMLRLTLFSRSGRGGSANKPERTPMTTEELIKLFDAIAGTIRIRPTGDAAGTVTDIGK